MGGHGAAFPPAQVVLQGLGIGPHRRLRDVVDRVAGRIGDALLRPDIDDHRGQILGGHGLEEGIDGMIHVSDLSWTRKINHPSEILKKSEDVEAIVLSIDKENQRVSLGIKQLDTDPWSDIDTKFKVGDIVKGTVAKIASFGAFVSLDGDIDGLIHISQLSEEHVERVKDILKVSDDVEARVIKVDKIERRIGLSIKAVEYSEEQLKKESQSFETLRPSSDLVGLEQAFNLATAATDTEEEEWSPSAEPKSEGKDKEEDKEKEKSK